MNNVQKLWAIYTAVIACLLLLLWVGSGQSVPLPTHWLHLGCQAAREQAEAAAYAKGLRDGRVSVE